MKIPESHLRRLISEELRNLREVSWRWDPKSSGRPGGRHHPEPGTVRGPQPPGSWPHHVSPRSFQDTIDLLRSTDEFGRVTTSGIYDHLRAAGYTDDAISVVVDEYSGSELDEGSHLRRLISEELRSLRESDPRFWSSFESDIMSRDPSRWDPPETTEWPAGTPLLARSPSDLSSPAGMEHVNVPDIELALRSLETNLHKAFADRFGSRMKVWSREAGHRRGVGLPVYDESGHEIQRPVADVLEAIHDLSNRLSKDYWASHRHSKDPKPRTHVLTLGALRIEIDEVILQVEDLSKEITSRRAGTASPGYSTERTTALPLAAMHEALEEFKKKIHWH